MNISTCPGFAASGMAAGIKKNGKKDLGLILSERPATVAGVFTKNKVKAAPVQLDADRVRAGICRAIIVNSGNANCCTGEQGMLDANAMAADTARQLAVPENQVLVSSTGVIGEPLPVEKVTTAVPDLVDALSPGGFPDFAESIMTTDTVPKVVHRSASFNGKPFSLLAIGKGAGMINPDMATLLCFVCTDVEAPADVLNKMLVASVNRSLNRITIDGDMSTNDTVLLMANGVSGVRVESGLENQFQELLDDALIEMARMLVKDGEGVTKLVDIVIMGAPSDEAARQTANAVGNSNLVKTAFFGEDANWGRILGAVGRAGVNLNPHSIDLFFDDVQMVKNSVGCGPKAESEASRVLEKPEFKVIVDLNMGNGSASVITCDFSLDYVKINSDYRS